MSLFCPEGEKKEGIHFPNKQAPTSCVVPDCIAPMGTAVEKVCDDTRRGCSVESRQKRGQKYGVLK